MTEKQSEGTIASQESNDINWKKKAHDLKQKLEKCQQQKGKIIDKKNIEIKNKQDKIDELEYRLKEQNKSGQKAPKSPEKSKEFQEIQEENTELRKENEDLMEENEELIMEVGHLEEKIDELKEEKKELKGKLMELKEENKRLLKRLERYKEEKKIGFHLPSNSEIRGDINSDEIIQVENETKVLGSLESEEDILLGYGNDIKGYIVSNESAVKIGNASEVGGMVKGEEVRLAEGVKAKQIRADEKLILGKNCKVSDVFALGDVKLEEGVKIEGSLRYAGDLEAAKGVEITDSLIPLSKEEIRELSEKHLEKKPAFPQVIVKDQVEEFEPPEDADESKVEFVEEKIFQVDKMLEKARKKDLFISEEKVLLKEGGSLYKKGKYDEALEKLSESHSRLKEKMPEDTEIEKKESEEDEEHSIDSVIESSERESSEDVEKKTDEESEDEEDVNSSEEVDETENEDEESNMGEKEEEYVEESAEEEKEDNDRSEENETKEEKEDNEKFDPTTFVDLMFLIPSIKEEIHKEEPDLRNTAIPRLLDQIYKGFKEVLLDQLNVYLKQKDFETIKGEENGKN